MVKPAMMCVLIPIVTLATSFGWSQQAVTISNASASATELARIQAYLDARYMAKDVWRTFVSASGQTIDCIDWFAQPSVKAMAAKGTPIAHIPTPPPLPSGVVKASIPDWALNGAPDVNGVPRTCAPNGVAMVRVTVAEILAAGGLDAYLARRRRLVAPPAEGYNASGYAHETERFNGPPNPAITFGQSVLSINDPTIPFAGITNNWSTLGSHSIAQTWMVSGTGYNIGGGACTQLGYCLNPGAPSCTQNCLETVEVGWERTSDYSMSGGPHAYFFIYSTKDGYKTDCYPSVYPGCNNFFTTQATGYGMATHCQITHQVSIGSKWNSKSSPLTTPGFGGFGLTGAISVTSVPRPLLVRW